MLRRWLVRALEVIGARCCWWAYQLRPEGLPCEECGCDVVDGRCYACEYHAEEGSKLDSVYGGGFEDGYTEASLRFGENGHV